MTRVCAARVASSPAARRSGAQPAPLAGYDVFRGAQVDNGLTGLPVQVPDSALATLTTLSCDVAQVLPTGTTMSVTTNALTPANTAHYFLVGHSNPTSGAKTALGRGVNNAVRISPITCP